jgi:hypothetical protein
MTKQMTAVEFLLDFESKYPRLQSMVSTEEDKKFFYSTAQGAQITCDVMIEFAKMHVKAALEAANTQIRSKSVFEPNCSDHTPYMGPCGNCDSYHNYDVLVGIEVDKNSILNAYPETLIN